MENEESVQLFAKLSRWLDELASHTDGDSTSPEP
jgi:hypothetical protein